MPGPAPRKAAMRKGHWRSHGAGSKVKVCRALDAPGTPPEEPRLGACRKSLRYARPVFTPAVVMGVARKYD